MRTVRYVVCNVFTDRALTGNGLAIFTDARSLDAEAMQALAREVNLPECAFVVRPTRPDAKVRLEIFSPSARLPYAANSILATAFILSGPLSRDVIQLETELGVVSVSMLREDGRIYRGWMAERPPAVRPFGSTSELVRALGVSASSLPIESYYNGSDHVFVELSDVAAVTRLHPALAQLAAFSLTTVTAYCHDGTRWKTRVFLCADPPREDAATGSAVGSLVTHLLRHGRISAGDEIVIDQGLEIDRPSRLYGRAIAAGGELDRVELGGGAIIVGRGEFTIPTVPTSIARPLSR